ncbi:vWA domain-containing protein [Lederbergia citri]|uniref:VWA domain-containing protein n=1 Tax=Lederbergia citri TaxID=2833580 RepID=A0A942YGI1_9BACI|nr:VWA domain-containing protein [Lederbergia citri]MBS4194390.1 VWA domain-containing protein [Lederbergia citri]
MYRFIDFNDEKIDSLLLMELADLTKTLAKDQEYNTEFRVHSYLSKDEKKIYVGHFWNHRPEMIMWAGMKSDVFLRAFGNMYYTEDQVIVRYGNWCETTKIPRFAKQIFVLAEDIRIEELCKKTRPGMTKEFRIRREIYNNFFETQLKVNIERSLFLDAIYNLIYLMMNSETPIFALPDLNENWESFIKLIRSRVERFYDASSTNEIAEICKSIVGVIEENVNRDMVNEYFHLYLQTIEMQKMPYDDLQRKDSLANDDDADEKSSGEEDIVEEELKTWHRETKTPGELFLQFDLNQGTKTDMLTNEAREGEAGDQALAIVQGSAKKTSNKDFSNLETKDKKDTEGNRRSPQYGVENKHAEAIFLSKMPPSAKQISDYNQFKNDIQLYKKRLKKSIDLTLEHKKILPRSDLQYGRLNRKLIRFFTEEQPRVFHKKLDESKEIDAVFSLLIDCSASMEDKMNETKKGIILFHEALKSVRVSHEVTGFWEDANEASKTRQPNYFKTVIDFTTSLMAHYGPEIMGLEPEEDNRDGFAIRIMGERLSKRIENQKFLIVFSDGEPAAYGYDQNGIVDTHEAVTEARKKGIEVFNIFLSQNGVGDEQRKVFQNIYGPYSLVAPTVAELPDLLLPLLKKLLLRAIL